MKFDFRFAYFGRKTCLGEVIAVDIDGHDPGGAASLHFNRVEAPVAADVQDTAAPDLVRNGSGETCPFGRRIIAERMIGSRFYPVEIDIVKPCPERLDPFLHDGAVDLSARR